MCGVVDGEDRYNRVLFDWQKNEYGEWERVYYCYKCYDKIIEGRQGQLKSRAER